MCASHHPILLFVEQNDSKILNVDYYFKPLFELTVMCKQGQIYLSQEWVISRFEPGETVAPVFLLTTLPLELPAMSGKKVWVTYVCPEEVTAISTTMRKLRKEYSSVLDTVDILEIWPI